MFWSCWTRRSCRRAVSVCSSSPVFSAGTVETAPADFEAQVRDGKLDLALSVPEDYGKEFEAGRDMLR